MKKSDILTSKSYKRVEANLKNRLKPRFRSHYSHHLVPGFNFHRNLPPDDSDVETIVQEFQEYPYHCDLPKPLLPPAKLPRTVLNEEDPAFELISLKSCIKNDLDRMKNYVMKHEKEFDVGSNSTIKWEKINGSLKTKLPRYVVDMSHTLDKDPDQYFEGIYNWYYTGGCCENIPLHHTNILVFPYMGELVSVPLKNVEEYLWKPLLSSGDKCELNATLYELRHNINNNTSTILGRCKYSCNFYMLSNNDNKCDLTQIHKETSIVPYTSADISQFNINQYCTANVERRVALWDIRKLKSVTSNTVETDTEVEDSWSNIQFDTSDCNILLYADRCCLHYLDVRIPLDKPTLTLCPKPHLEKCEQLSLNIASRNNFCTYLGTSHSVLMCDKRSPKECVQQKWTHQFVSPPFMSRTINRENKEFLVLSSHIAGEATIIVNTWTSNDIAYSFNYPYTPPHIKDTLNKSQAQGMCLNPYLRDRFELSTTGCSMLMNDAQNIFLVFQTSIGDVYYQCITHDEALDKYSPINTKSYCILKAWQNAISPQTESIVPLTMTNKFDMQHLFKSFTNVKLRLRYDKPDDCYVPSWKQSLDRLNSYKDILAPELLAIWEMCEEVGLPSTAAPHQKVLSWLESANAEALILSQEPPDIVSSQEVLTPINTQELISVSQEVDISNFESNVVQDLLPKVKVTSSRKKGNIGKR